MSDYVPVRTEWTPGLAAALRCCVLEEPFPALEVGNESNFARLCQTEGLLGGLVAQLERHGHPNERLLAACREVYKSEFFGWARYQSWLGEINGVLAAAGLEALLLKGAALRLTVSPEPGLRRMSDIDLFVPQARAAEVYAALHQHGLYGEPGQGAWTDGTGRSLDVHVGSAGVLERHWGFTEEALWRASEPSGEHSALRVLRTSEQLNYVAVHALKHSFQRLMWLPDIHRLYQVETAPDLPRPVRACLFLVEEAVGRELYAQKKRFYWWEKRILRSMLSCDQRPLGQLLLGFYMEDWLTCLRYFLEVCQNRQEPFPTWFWRLAGRTVAGLKR